MEQEELDKIIAIISTHDEGDGSHCDTGADMEWSCRSECVSGAVLRLKQAWMRGEI
jgi:hypothetical protein